MRAGHRLIYDSAARVLHRPSDAGRAPSRDYWRLMIRNWIWIFHRYYPAPEAWRRTALYALVYLYKGARNRQLAASVQGIRDGIAGRRPPTSGDNTHLTSAQIARIDALNPRRKILAGRG